MAVLIKHELSDEEYAAVARCVATLPPGAPKGAAPAFASAEAWLATQIATLVRECVRHCSKQDLEKVGVRRLEDLTSAELESIRAARAKEG